MSAETNGAGAATQGAQGAGGAPGATEQHASPAPASAGPRIPIGQVVYDDVFLWIGISLVLSLVIYNAWGLLDLVRIPVLQ